jgi:hypothetical protein
METIRQSPSRRGIQNHKLSNEGGKTLGARRMAHGARLKGHPEDLWSSSPRRPESRSRRRKGQGTRKTGKAQGAWRMAQGTKEQGARSKEQGARGVEQAATSKLFRCASSSRIPPPPGGAECPHHRSTGRSANRRSLTVAASITDPAACLRAIRPAVREPSDARCKVRWRSVHRPVHSRSRLSAAGYQTKAQTRWDANTKNPTPEFRPSPWSIVMPVRKSLSRKTFGLPPLRKARLSRFSTVPRLVPGLKRFAPPRQTRWRVDLRGRNQEAQITPADDWSEPIQAGSWSSENQNLSSMTELITIIFSRHHRGYR